MIDRYGTDGFDGIKKSPEGHLCYWEDVKPLLAENKRLREAIKTHRRNVWGDEVYSLWEALSLLVSILPDNAYLDSEERKSANNARTVLQEAE